VLGVALALKVEVRVGADVAVGAITAAVKNLL